MTTTCYGCGKTEDRDRVWSQDSNGHFWHLECRQRDFDAVQGIWKAAGELLNRPIKERHDGHGSRDG